MRTIVVKIVATAFGVGFSPYLSGTCGSVLGVGLFYILRDQPRGVLSLVAFLITLVGIVVSFDAERVFGVKDSPRIVIDEVAGQLVTFLFVPYSLVHLVAGFLLFRFFDILKPFPARWAQDHLPGGMGVMMDDVIAGMQAGLLLLLVNYFLNL